MQVLGSRESAIFQNGIAFEVERSTLVFYRQGSIKPQWIEKVEGMIAEAAPFVTLLATFAAQGQPA